MIHTLKRPNEIRVLLPKDKLKSWHNVSTLRGILSIVVEWAAIVASGILCENFFSWPLYIVLVFFLGARYLALGLIMHESVHNLISRNTKLNDFLAEVFCAWPLLYGVFAKRSNDVALARASRKNQTRIAFVFTEPLIELVDGSGLIVTEHKFLYYKIAIVSPCFGMIKPKSVVKSEFV